jgi:hypothetical protein
MQPFPTLLHILLVLLMTITELAMARIFKHQHLVLLLLTHVLLLPTTEFSLKTKLTKSITVSML